MSLVALRQGAHRLRQDNNGTSRRTSGQGVGRERDSNDPIEAASARGCWMRPTAPHRPHHSLTASSDCAGLPVSSRKRSAFDSIGHAQVGCLACLKRAGADTLFRPLVHCVCADETGNGRATKEGGALTGSVVRDSRERSPHTSAFLRLSPGPAGLSMPVSDESSSSTLSRGASISSSESVSCGVFGRVCVSSFAGGACAHYEGTVRSRLPARFPGTTPHPPASLLVACDASVKCPRVVVAWSRTHCAPLAVHDV